MSDSQTLHGDLVEVGKGSRMWVSGFGVLGFWALKVLGF